MSSNNKQAAEVAATAKICLCNNNRALEALKHKSAATLFTFAATFCSIIIETQKRATKLSPQRPHENQSGNQVVSENTANQLSPTEIPSIAYSCTVFVL